MGELLAPTLAVLVVCALLAVAALTAVKPYEAIVIFRLRLGRAA